MVSGLFTICSRVDNMIITWNQRRLFLKCEACGRTLDYPERQDEKGKKYVEAKDLVEMWFDHQLIDCGVAVEIPQQREGNDESSVCR